LGLQRMRGAGRFRVMIVARRPSASRRMEPAAAGACLTIMC